MTTRRQIVFGSVAAIAAATVAIPAKAAERFEPFEVRFYIMTAGKMYPAPEHMRPSVEWIIPHTETHLTIPFNENGDAVLDVLGFNETARRQIRIGIQSRIPERYDVVFDERDGVLFCKLQRKLQLPRGILI